MIGKAVVSGISLILVVAVVIGMVATVIRSNGSNDENLSPQMKAVTQIYQPILYKETCIMSLGSVNSTDPKEFIKAGQLAIHESFNKSFDVSGELIVKANKGTPIHEFPWKIARSLCKKAIGYLQDTATKMLNSDLSL